VAAFSWPPPTNRSACGGITATSCGRERQFPVAACNAATKKLSFLGQQLAAVMIGRLLQMPGRYAAGI